MAMQQQNENRALVSLENQSGIIPGASEWKLMRDMAASLVPTGFLPETIKTPEQAVAIMLKGRELNVPPMYAMSNIVIVKGKPSVSAEMMLALIYRDHGKRALRVKNSDDRSCTVEYRLDGWDDVSSYTFTIAQAQKANLTKNPTWTAYPAAMLRARCISAVARMAFPECIAGMYVPGELGEDVTVTDDGEVVSVSTPQVNVETGEIEAPRQSRQDRPRSTKANDAVSIDIESNQAPLHGESDERERANNRAHAIAQGLFGKTGHDVLHVMADLVNRDSVADCDAFQLNKMADRLEKQSPEELDTWYAKWIEPRMPKPVDGGDA